MENSLPARVVCLKDFLKKCLILPFALLNKAYKTCYRTVGVCFGAILVLITVGSSPTAREFFVERIACLAKDLADWILFPIAIFTCFIKLLMALLLHPVFYFNSAS